MAEAREADIAQRIWQGKVPVRFFTEANDSPAVKEPLYVRVADTISCHHVDDDSAMLLLTASHKFRAKTFY